MAIDPSGYRVLLVSLIPTHLQAKGFSNIYLSYYFFSLTTDLNRSSWNPRVPAAAAGPDDWISSVLGVRVYYSLLLALCRFPFVSSQWLL